MNKQTTQVVVLCALLAALGVGCYIEFGGSPPPSPPPDHTKVHKPRPKPPALIGMSWVNAGRLDHIESEVEEGRDPFVNTLLPPKPPSIPPPLPPESPSGAKLKLLKPLPSVTAILTRPVTLRWVTVGEVQRSLRQEKIPVEVLVKAEDGARISLRGASPDIDLALKSIQAIDKQPPKPDFKLVGIVKENTSRFAAIRVESVTYQLYEGETIPRLGWTVTSITDVGVKLTKGRQQVLVKM